jgi:hypothetical protein
MRSSFAPRKWLQAGLHASLRSYTTGHTTEQTSDMQRCTANARHVVVARVFVTEKEQHSSSRRRCLPFGYNFMAPDDHAYSFAIAE